MTRSPADVIVAWYDRKTEFLLEKYGPGPRVHYHTGIAPPDVVPAASREALRRQIVASQEEMLWRAARAWGGAARLGGEIFDVGCGLGGTALFLAGEFGARVTALSPVARHLSWVRRFADEAGLGGRVVPQLGDAHALDGAARFDVALSFGATTYFDRVVYFEGLARVVRPGGWVFIEDTFLGRAALAAPFDAYWTSHIGWPGEYEAAATRSGFETVAMEDVSRDASGFWKLSVAYSRILLDGDSAEEAAARRASIEWQSQIHEAYLDGGLRNLLLSFRRR
jgi:tocopherol O-methyltransferase